MRLSQDRGVNHTLIDAHVRVELSSKKYQATHQAYLEAVQSGDAAKKPVVYEKESPPATTKAGGEKEQAAGKTRAKAPTN